jgi:hypothetical protein
MEYLGINKTVGAIYEGEPGSGYRVLPRPALAPIRFVEVGKIPDLTVFSDGLSFEVFREDDFDPVTKLRRGRVFSSRHYSQPGDWYVHDPHQQSLPEVQWGNGVAQKTSLVTYARSLLPELANKSAINLPVVVIGKEPHITFWKIVSIETNLMGTPVLSLRAKHSLGDTPELREAQMPDGIRKPLAEALAKVEASVNRLSPVEVIDRCRDALSLAFGEKGLAGTKDLSDAITAYLRVKTNEPNPKEDLCSSCGRIVARLHSRGKPNEQKAHGTRSPEDGDADLALSCLKTVLIEFGWAR